MIPVNTHLICLIVVVHVTSSLISGHGGRAGYRSPDNWFNVLLILNQFLSPVDTCVCTLIVELLCM